MKTAKKTRSSYSGEEVKLNRVLKTLSFRIKSPKRTSPISQRHRRFLLRQVMSSGGNGVLTRRSFHPTPTKRDGRRLRRTEGVPNRLSMSEFDPLESQSQLQDETEYYEETINGVPYKLSNDVRIVASAGPRRHSAVSNGKATNEAQTQTAQDAEDIPNPPPLRRSPRCQESNDPSVTPKAPRMSGSGSKAQIRTAPPKVGPASSISAGLNSTPSGPVNQRKRLFPEHIRTAFLNVLPNKKARMDTLVMALTPQRKTISFRVPGGLNSSMTPCKAIMPAMKESSLVHELVRTPTAVAVAQSPVTPKALPNYMRPTVSSATKAAFAKSLRTSITNISSTTPMKFGNAITPMKLEMIGNGRSDKSGTRISSQTPKTAHQPKSGRENILRKSLLHRTPIATGMRRKTESYLNISAKVGSIRAPHKVEVVRHRRSSPRLNETFTMEEDK